MSDDLSVVQIERALLGVLHVDPSLVEQVDISHGEFSDAGNANVFRGISTLYREHGRVDLHLLRDWASTNCRGSMGEMWTALGASHDAFGSTDCVEQYAVEIRNQARLRVIVEAGKDIIRQAYESRDSDSALSAATQKLSEVEESFGGDERGDVSSIATAYMHEVIDVQSGKVEAR